VTARHIVTLALAALLAAALNTVAAGEAPAPVSAVDDSGQRITLAQPAHRIVALAPHITEQLFAIGAGDRIVGTTEFADYPADARRLPRVARAHSVDLERVAALRPDLIVVWGSGFPPATIDALRRLNLPVYVSEPGSLEAIATSMERLGVLTASPAAPRAEMAFRRQVLALRQRYAGRAPVRVFYQIWAQPLMTLAGTHVINEAIALCGGRNIFGQLRQIAPQVSVESVVAADPQVIVTAEAGGKPGDGLKIWHDFPAMAAVRNGQLVTLDADRINRDGPRILEEIGVLCERIDAARKKR
jgi:iron complex transport system substrate-binding protein